MAVQTTVEPAPGWTLHLAAGDAGLCGLSFEPLSGFDREHHHAILRETAAQLERYFRGELREFDVPLDLQGTEFQKRVWAALLEIPYGETRSYSDLARRLGKPNATRAVGAANGANPVAIIVPCHRVIASNGSLWGYGGGLERKRFLLDLEASAKSSSLFSSSTASVTLR